MLIYGLLSVMATFVTSMPITDESNVTFRRMLAAQASYAARYAGPNVNPFMKYVESARLIGQGYNIIKSNTHTVALGQMPLFGGAADAGITTASIFDMTWSDVEKEDEFLLPDKVSIKQWPGDQCLQELDYELIPGILAYQKILLANTVIGDGTEHDIECKRSLTGKNYRGTKNFTKLGIPCKKWNRADDSNNCRNRNGLFTEPSCYIDDKNVKSCGVRFCRPGLMSELETGAFLGPYIANAKSFTKRNDPEDAFEEVDRSIFVENRETCSEGVLVLDDMSPEEEPQVTDAFRLAICKLPIEYGYSTTAAYNDIIDKFGTNIIVGANVGRLSIHRYEVRRADLYDTMWKLDETELMSTTDVRRNGTKITRQFAKVDLQKMSYKWRKELAESKGSDRSFESVTGSVAVPQPFRLRLRGIEQALNPAHWRDACNQTKANFKCCVDLPKLQGNLENALSRYPSDHGVMKLTYRRRMFKENILWHELKWPSGKYSIPLAIPSCYGAGWKVGSVSHGSHTKNEISHPEMLAVRYTYVRPSYGMMTQQFCTKFHHDKTARPWPKGSYCIVRYGGTCPDGFQDGFIYWKDYLPLSNTKRGYLPDGDHGSYKDTKTHYCCRQDGPANEPIFLPTSKPFYLMMIGEECQKVYGLKVTKQAVFWDSNDLCALCSRSWQTGGLHPRNDYYYENNKLYYCWYSAFKYSS